MGKDSESITILRDLFRSVAYTVIFVQRYFHRSNYEWWIPVTNINIWCLNVTHTDFYKDYIFHEIKALWNIQNIQWRTTSLFGKTHTFNAYKDLKMSIMLSIYRDLFVLHESRLYYQQINSILERLHFSSH